MNREDKEVRGVTYTTWFEEHVTPNHEHGLVDVSQFVRFVHFVPPAALYSATSADFSVAVMAVPATTRDAAMDRVGDRDAAVVRDGAGGEHCGVDDGGSSDGVTVGVRDCDGGGGGDFVGVRDGGPDFVGVGVTVRVRVFVVELVGVFDGVRVGVGVGVGQFCASYTLSSPAQHEGTAHALTHSTARVPSLRSLCRTDGAVVDCNTHHSATTHTTKSVTALHQLNKNTVRDE